MRNQLQKIIGLLMLVVLFGFNAYSQNPTYIMEIKNDVAVSPTEYTFDLYIKNTSTNATYIPTWELYGLQAGIKVNNAILAGGTITPTIVAGFSDLSPSNQQTTANLSMSGFTSGVPNANYGVKMTVKPAAGVGTGTPITATEMRVCRIKLTNSVPFAPNSYANLTWSFAAAPWLTKVSFYKPLATEITVQASHIITNRNNPALNATPIGPTVQNVTGGGSYCAGTTPTGVSVGLAGSEVGYNYQLLKGGVAEGTPVAGTGAALTWDNLTAGVYTVEATTTPATAMTGSVTVTENALPATPIVNVVDNCDGTSTLTITNPEVGATFAWTGGLTGNPATANVAGNYVVTQEIGGCISLASVEAVAAPKTTPATPVVTVMDNCGNSDLSTTATGTLLWSTGASTSSINVLVGGTYTVTATENGCTSAAGSGVAAPIATPATPVVTVMDNCGNSDLSTTATGTLLWSNAATTSSINVLVGGTYTVTATENGCTSAAGSGVAAPIATPATPVVTVMDNCGNSDLSTTATGTLLWSTGASTSSINVLVGGTYTVTATENGCTSAAGSGVAAPIATPATPVVTVMDNCGNSDLSTTATGTLLWSTGASTSSINVLVGGTYTVTATENGCTSAAGSGVAAPITLPAQPVVTVNNTCGNSAFTITNGEAGATFNWTPAVADLNNVPAGTYTVTQTVGACTSIASANVVAAPLAIPAQPVVTVNNTCGNSAFTITNGEAGATFNWTPAVADLNNVPAGTYTVTQTVGTCISIASANVIAAPLTVPAQLIVTVNNTCNNSAFTITNGEAGATFNWIPAVADLNNVPAGTYTVTQTVGTCTSIASANVVAAPIAPTVQTVTIAASANPSVQGQPVTYMATVTPAAAGQIFDWYVNTVWQNTAGVNTFSYVPANGDVVSCAAVPTGCYTGGISNNITMNVNPTPNVTNTWIGLTTDWNTASNWTMGIPMANHDVIIPSAALNFPIIGAPAVCHDITIQSGAQLIQNSTLAIGGKVYAQQLLTPGTWHFVSSPINNATAYAFSNANPVNFGQNLFLQTYNEAWIFAPGTSPWVDVTNGPGEIMSAGKGYEAWSDNNHIITMEGTQLNSANIVTPVMYTPAATFPGFNLIGNSYPSAIDIHGFNTWGVNMDAAIYVWDGAQYLFQNTLFGTLGFTIAPKQGFMVKANAPGAMFTIPSTAKTFGGSFLKSTVADVLKLKVSGNGYNDAAFINFNSNATANYDGQFDVEKIFGIDAAPQFYSTITNKNLSINTLPSLTSPVVVPMALNVGANATYTITASEMSSFANGTTITLEDTKTGTFTNLMQQAVYTFTASPADNANRFKVHFGVNGINENANGNISIYSNSNVIYVNNSSNEVVKEIVVMNVLGQEILNKKAANTTVNTITMDVASAYYVVKVVTENKVYTEKVYVR